MSDDKNGVNETPNQEAGLPKPVFSESGSVGSTSQLSPDAIAELSKALSPMIEDTVNRAVQSTKDKRFSKLDKVTRDMEVLASLKEQGATIPPEVERDYQLRDYVTQQIDSRLASEPSDNGISQSAPKAAGQFDALTVIKSFGLDTGDAEVIKLMSGTYRNTDHFQAEAAKLAYTRASKPAPSAAGTPPLGGGNAQSSLSETEKEAKYIKLNELYKNPTKSAAEIKVLEKELGMV
jgi:hypothetical protein